MAETSTIFGFMKYVSATDILSDFKKTVDGHFVNSLKYLYSPGGETSQGWAVFVENVAASFIDDGARHTVPLATITLN